MNTKDRTQVTAGEIKRECLDKVLLTYSTEPAFKGKHLNTYIADEIGQMPALKLPTVYSVIATKGRHKQLERVVGMALRQDYAGSHTILIYNNSATKQVMGKYETKPNQKLILINAPINPNGKPWTNLGEIFTDIVNNLIPRGVVVNHMDDDDLYEPNHVSLGVQGLLKHNKFAYKPQFSYYQDAFGTTLTQNVLEPSIFVWSSWLHSTGYNQDMLIHQKWLEPLVAIGQIFVDPDGVPTYTYTWVGDVFHVSGNNCPENYQNHNAASTDEGDGIITPL